MRDKSRSQETKEKFKKAFFELYALKRIENITIKEVAELAGFNRGTFYLYYKNVYDLLQKIEQELLDDLAKEVTMSVQFYFGLVDKPNNSEWNRNYAKFLERAKYIRILNGENGDPRFKVRSKNIIKNEYRKYFKLNKGTDANKFEYLLEYCIEANMAIMHYWFVNQDKNVHKIPLEEVWDIIHMVDGHGFKKTFEKFIDK